MGSAPVSAALVGRRMAIEMAAIERARGSRNGRIG